MELTERNRDIVKLWAVAKGSGNHRRTCPECSADRFQGKHIECLSVTVEKDHALYRCWHCEKEGAVRLFDQPYNPPAQPKKAESKAVKSILPALDALAVSYLKQRGISRETAEMFSVTGAYAFFPDIHREDHGIAFAYYIDNKLIGHKVRATSEKAHVCKPALYSLCGAQNLDMSESTDLLITEGEIDMLSFAEAKVPNVTSVPNGASSFSRSEGDDTKATYAFLWHSKKDIDKAKRVLIATDADEPGDKLADELARRIGKHRCWRVKYPEGCKDGNDVLLKHGVDAVRKLVQEAEPWPVDGLYEAQQFFPELYTLYENGFGERVLTGLDAVDDIYSVGKGLLTVVTGIPANGKSTFIDQLMVNLARKHDHSFGICSFENPPHVHIAKLSEMLLQKHFFDMEIGNRMSKKELDAVLPFVSKHFKFLYSDDGKKATIESIIERIKTAVFRWGIYGALIDPYNYIARPKSAENETQWIDEMLTQLRMCAAAHDLHIWLVAHPTKLTGDAEGRYPPPRGFNISGSAAWYSKPDFGLTIHKDPDAVGRVRIINWKTRFDWLGKEGEASLLYDTQRNIYMHDGITDYKSYGDV